VSRMTISPQEARDRHETTQVKSVLIMESENGSRRNSRLRKHSSPAELRKQSFLEPVIDLGRRLSVRFNGPRDFNQTRRRLRRKRKCSNAIVNSNVVSNTLTIPGPRQLSVDIDRGVVILEVPEKNYQGTVWRFVSHYSGVLRKYFGLNKVESDARARTNSSTDQVMSIHLMQCHRPTSIEDLCQTTRFKRTEIKHLYRIFKTECPNGILTEERFHNIFSSFFPWGDEPYKNTVGNYSHYVFSLMDITDTGKITFKESI